MKTFNYNLSISEASDDLKLSFADSILNEVNSINTKLKTVRTNNDNIVEQMGSYLKKVVEEFNFALKPLNLKFELNQWRKNENHPYLPVTQNRDENVTIKASLSHDTYEINLWVEVPRTWDSEIRHEVYGFDKPKLTYGYKEYNKPENKYLEFTSVDEILNEQKELIKLIYVNKYKVISTY